MRPLLIISALLLVGIAVLMMRGERDGAANGVVLGETMQQDDGRRFEVDSGSMSEVMLPANETPAP